MPPGRPKRFDPRRQRDQLRDATKMNEELELERVEPAPTVSTLDKARAGIAAYRAYKKGTKMGEQIATSQWDAGKSTAKANTAATTAATGTAAGAGGTAAALAFVRTLWPTALPWDASMDTTIVATAGVLIGPLWTWIRTYIKDKVKHGG